MAVPTALVSGEGVAFELPRAGIGSRVVAAAVDLALQFIALILLLLLDAAVAGSATVDPDALSAVLIVEVVLVVAGYPIGFEWLSHGKTLGKLWLGLRVVRDDGGPIGFRHALVRGLSGLILEKPGLLAPLSTAVGLITMGCSSRDKRVGDLLAGTFVLNERAGPSRSVAPFGYAVPYQLQGWAMSLDLSRLDDRLALGLRQFVSRAHEMTPAAQYTLGEQLRGHVLAVTAPPPPPGTPTPWLLTTVLAERRRRAELPHTGWPPQQPPPPQPPPPQQPPPLRPPEARQPPDALQPELDRPQRASGPTGFTPPR